MENSGDFISELAHSIGATVPAIKLLLTVLAGYPLALIFRKFVYNKGALIQHLFFAGSGFTLGYWHYGIDIVHNVIAILFTYCSFLLLNGSALNVAVVFIFNMVYLLTGYYHYGTEMYDINWTLPQCMLTLRLIGLAFDVYDGRQPLENLSNDSKKYRLVDKPGILEMLAHGLFPSAFQTGPQFPLRRYLDFINGKFNSKDGPADSTRAALRRFSFGVLYLALFQGLGLIVSDEYIYSDEYGQLPFYKKFILMGLWGRYAFYRYILLWLFTEGACILFGIAHNGLDEKGQIKWNGVENVNLYRFENTTGLSEYIQTFNLNTNDCIARYIYKRCKFLGNKEMSRVIALIFLAVWHGFHEGYYVTFVFEFFVIAMERDFLAALNSNERLRNFFASPKLQLPLEIFLRIYSYMFLGFYLMPFTLLKYRKYSKAFANINYAGIILLFLWPKPYQFILNLVRGKTDKQKLK